MIARLESLPPLPGDVPGTKIETLFACYRDFPDIASFYKSDGGVIALFGGRATLCGKFDAGELSAFLDFLGAREVECSPAAFSGGIGGFIISGYAVLTYTGAGCDTVLSGDAGEAYDILCDAQPDFPACSSRLEWLSDMRRRINCGRAGVYTRGGAAVLATAVGSGSAVIGAVACRQSARGCGSAKALVRDTAALYTARGKSVLTVAGSDSLTDYYTRIGFLRTGTLLLLTRAQRM